MVEMKESLLIMPSKLFANKIPTIIHLFKVIVFKIENLYFLHKLKF